MNPLLSTGISAFTADQLSMAYADPVTAVSVYCLLDASSQSVLDHLLYIDGPMPFQHIRSLHSTNERGDWNRALLGLKQLNILQGKGQDVWVNATFQRALIHGIAIDARPPSRAVAISNDPAEEDTSMADYEDAVYQIIINPEKSKPSSGNNGDNNNNKKGQHKMKDLFMAGALIDSKAPHQVTKAGFQFLVQPMHIQLWTCLSLHFSTQPTIACWQSLLSVCRFAADCQYDLAVDGDILTCFFLTDHRQRPTRLQHLLTSNDGKSGRPATIADHRLLLQIQVETNFHLYAIFPSPLALAVLSLFTTSKDRLPGLYRGRLTHHSVRSALKRGITADQLCAYLHSHAPSARPPPSTLLDQMRLWQEDLRRLKTLPDPVGYLYQQFAKQHDFEEAVRMVREARLPVLYESEGRRLLVVDERGHQLLRRHY